MLSRRAAHVTDPCSPLQYPLLEFAVCPQHFSLKTLFPVGVAADLGQRGADWKDKGWYPKSPCSGCGWRCSSASQGLSPVAAGSSLKELLYELDVKARRQLVLW